MGSEDEMFYGAEISEDLGLPVEDDAVIEVPRKDLERALKMLGDAQNALQSGSQAEGVRLSMQAWMILEKIHKGNSSP